MSIRRIVGPVTGILCSAIGLWCTCAGAAPVDYGAETPVGMMGGDMRLVIEVTGNGKTFRTTEAFIANGDGMLTGPSHEKFIAKENLLYGIERDDSTYGRETAPIEGPSLRMDCGGLTLYTLCKHQVIKCDYPLPMLVLNAPECARLLKDFAPYQRDTFGKPERFDVIFWCRDLLGANQSHVAYVDEAGPRFIKRMITKDKAESTLWRKGHLSGGATDPLVVRYGLANRYRFAPGTSLTWRYWLPNWTANAKADSRVNGIDLSGDWVQEGDPDKRYRIKLAPDYTHRPPLIIEDVNGKTQAFGAFNGGDVLYRTKWDASRDSWMRYQGKYEANRITWTNELGRDPVTKQFSAYKPVTWRRGTKGSVTYSGTWMYRYDLNGRTVVKRLGGGQVYNYKNGKMMPFRVVQSAAHFTIDLETGKLTGELAASWEYGGGEGEEPVRHGHKADLNKMRVDPIAYLEQKGLHYLSSKGDGGLTFSRGVKIQPAGWPSLSEDFALYGYSPTEGEMRSGKFIAMPVSFCVLTRSGQLPGMPGGVIAVKTGPRSSNRQRIGAALQAGNPAMWIVSATPSPGSNRPAASGVDGETGFKGPLRLNQFLPPNSKIEAKGDVVIVGVVLPYKPLSRSPAIFIRLSPGAHFDTGRYLATVGAMKDALEFLLLGGKTTIDDRKLLSAAAKLSVKLITPAASITRDGTVYIATHDEQTGKTSIKVIEGQVTVTPKNPALPPFKLTAGQQREVSLTAVGPLQPYTPVPGEGNVAPPGGVSLPGATVVGGSPTSTSPTGVTTMGSAGPRLPASGNMAPAPLNTLVHHQLTVDDAIAGGVFPVLSGSGNRIVYSHGARPSQIRCIDFDGSNLTTAMQTKNIPSELDISDDGTRVMVHHISREIYSASASGGGERRLVWVSTGDPQIVKARMTGDGKLVYFLLGRKALLNGSDVASPAGLHVVNAEGGTPRLLVGQTHLQKLLGLPADQGVAFRPSLDVSGNGGRVAFAVVAYSKVNAGPKIVVVDGNGGNLRLVAEGTKDSRGNVGQVAITPDGRLISYRIASWGPPMITGVVNADGSNKRIITKSDGPLRYPNGNLIGEPVTFTADGNWLQLGSTGRLIATDGSGRIYSLSATRAGAGKVLLNGGMLRGTMDHQARRYAYLCKDERNSREFRQRVQIASLEINPTDLRGAPELSDVTVQPGYLIPDKVGATVSVAVASPHKLILVSKVPIFKGLADPGVSSEIFYDNGRTSGDKTAGDSVFTSNRLYAMQAAKMGPRTIRVDAESRGEDARRHATAVDVAPIPVTTKKPEPPVPPEPANPPEPTTPATPTATSTTPGAKGMRIAAEHRRVAEGEKVTVPVWLKDVSNLANLNFEVRYDPSVAKPAGKLIKGNLLGKAIFSANASEPGRMRMGFAQTSGLAGTGTVAQLPMQAVGESGALTPLTVTVTSIDDPNGATLSIQKIHGSILIVGPDGHVPGDCDGDGKITAADAMCALKMSVGNMQLNIRLDADGDGKVTSGDARVLLKRAVGIE